MQRLDLRHALGQGTARIVIDNPWGDIYVRRSQTREVYAHAVVQQLGEPAARADVRLDGDERSARLVVRYAGAGSDCQRERAGGGRVGRTDLAVFVPVDVDLRVRSACDGRISTDHIVGDLAASTDTGAIRASASGRATLSSQRGVIRAFLQAESAQPSRIESAGGIVLTMPPAVRTRLQASACDGLRAAGFDWTPERNRDGCEAASIVLGDGASRVSVRSRASFVDLRLRGTARQ